MKVKINFFEKEAKELADQLQAIDYTRLPISDYNKEYLERLEKAYLYYTRICGYCLATSFTTLLHPDRSFTLVDYGGGTGLLSMMAKKIGIERVIYIDRNPQSVETVKVLKEQTGLGPDIILQGDSDTLAAWCKDNKIKPELLVSTDVIEHIYNLDKFFAELTGINKEMELMFTTGSNPLNIRKKRKLQEMMLTYERGGNASPNYHELRKDFIIRKFPEYTPQEADKIAGATRGLTFDDIEKIFNQIGKISREELQETLPASKDLFNTCDPRDGNWMERILPIEEYERLKPHDYGITLGNGFYNADRKNPFISLIVKVANYFILRSKMYGLLVAPFIIIHYYPSTKSPK